MVFIKPDIEAGTVDGNHADVPHPPIDHHEDETDEEPDVEDIEVVNRGTSKVFIKSCRKML